MNTPTTPNKTRKVWFITGASRGFGRLWAEEALLRGDKVAATARSLSSVSDLASTFGDAVLPLALDVTDRAAVFEAVQKAHSHFGRLDVVLSNAGYGLVGAVEETSLEETRAIFETNVFGTLGVIQAALPLLRNQGSGHILAVSSVAGVAGFSCGAIYSGTKFAVEGLLEGMSQEISQFGIHTTIVEPGPFKTEFMSGSSLKITNQIDAYVPLRAGLMEAFSPETFSDPRETTEFLFKVVDAEQPPLRLLLGPMRSTIDAVYSARIADWDKWAGVRA